MLVELDGNAEHNVSCHHETVNHQQVLIAQLLRTIQGWRNVEKSPTRFFFFGARPTFLI
jgi:hypothetical protein